MAVPPPDLTSRADVAQLLGLPTAKLTWWFYAYPKDRRYRSFEVPRMPGAPPRAIRAPIKPIKELQRRLADALAASYEPPPQVHGFVASRGPFTNARVHQRQRLVLKIDLADFFPTIHFGRVRGLFMAYPFTYPADVATLLAQICCHDNELPQGAPTSPIVSNYICRRLDRELGHVAQDERCFYSRYADDLTFSTDRISFPATWVSFSVDGELALEPKLRQVIGSNGFVINEEKTRFMRRTQRQRITGFVVNEKPNVSSQYVRSLRNVLYIWRKHGRDAAIASFATNGRPPHRPPGKPDPPIELVLRGRVQYVGSVRGWRSSTYQSLASALQAVDDTFHPSTLRTLTTRTRVIVYVEGATDVVHLKAAEGYFHERGEFEHLRLDFPGNSASRSDAELLERCKRLSFTARSDVCVCIFDSDNPKVLRQALEDPPGYRLWSNRVVSLQIAAPPWRGPQERLCIEMLHTPDFTNEIHDGRKLYLAEEFDESGLHRNGGVRRINLGGASLVQTDVRDIANNESVGLAKTVFAERARDRDGLSWEGFRPTFERLEEAVAQLVA